VGGELEQRLIEAAQRVKPLPVDPEVLRSIRPMRPEDAARVAELHEAAMGNSLWARLGQRFLCALYRGLLASRHFHGHVYVEDGRVRGFIAGSTDPDAMMSETFRRYALRLGPAALPRALDPRILRKLLETRRYAALSNAVPLPSGTQAESLFCTFEPDLRGKKVSGAINKVLFESLRDAGHRYVKITTEVDNEGANRQLQSWGFGRMGEFRFYGKQMVTYVLDLRASPRLHHP
jgi:hypothetical protein